MPPLKMTSIACTKCNYQYSVDDKFIGKLLTCPKCQAKFYSKGMNTALQQGIKSSATSTAKAVPLENSANAEGKARKKKIITRGLITLGIIVLAFLLWQSFKFATRPMDDRPEPKHALIAAQAFMKEKSQLPNIDTAIFSKSFKLDILDMKKKSYSVNTSVSIFVPGQKNPSEKKLSIRMTYLGEDQWEYIDYSMDK